MTKFQTLFDDGCGSCGGDAPASDATPEAPAAEEASEDDSE